MGKAEEVTCPEWRKCPKCKSEPGDHVVKDYNMLLGEGKVYCKKCGAFVRHWDRD